MCNMAIAWGVLLGGVWFIIMAMVIAVEGYIKEGKDFILKKWAYPVVMGFLGMGIFLALLSGLWTGGCTS